MYQVRITHMTEAWERGDLSSKEELVDVKTYKTRKEAKAFIESKLAGKKTVYRSYHRGDTPSICTYFTGHTWIEENTGEERQEYYSFKLTKL